MTDLYLCPGCREPFVATDKRLVSQHGGYCTQCTKIAILRKFGLPEDFLSRRIGPGA